MKWEEEVIGVSFFPETRALQKGAPKYQMEHGHTEKTQNERERLCAFLPTFPDPKTVVCEKSPE